MRLVAFDKTGTLTEGRPKVVAVHGPEGILAAAAAVEAASEHPLAAAIREAATETPEAARDFRALPGLGAEATVGGARISVGPRGCSPPCPRRWP